MQDELGLWRREVGEYWTIYKGGEDGTSDCLSDGFTTLLVNNNNSNTSEWDQTHRDTLKISGAELCLSGLLWSDVGLTACGTRM